MLYFIAFVACKSPDADDTVISNDLANRPFCKARTYVFSSNGQIVTEHNYTWEGNTQTATNIENVYNERGYPIRMFNREDDGYIYESTYTYACDDWCKLQQYTFAQGYEDQDMSVSGEEYTWEGNTQSATTGNNSWIYNDLGYVIESYESGSGYSVETWTNYECNAYWCKAQDHTYINSTNGAAMDEIYTQYEWQGNTQYWDSNYITYNEYGYVLEQEVQFGNTTNFNAITYDCD